MFSSDKRQAQDAPKSWEVIADRLDTLSHTVSATAAALAKKDGELVATRRALESRIADLEAYITNALQELRSAATAPTTRPRAGKREPIDGKFVLLSEEVTTLTTQFEALASRLETTSGRVEAHDRELQTLVLRGGDAAEAPPDPTLDRRLADVVAGLADAVERLDAQQEQIGSLERTGDAVDSDALQRQIEAVDKALAQRVQEVVEGLTATAERLDDQQTQIASLVAAPPASSDGALQQRLEELDRALAERVQGVAEGLAATTEQLRAQQDRIASLETEGPASDGRKGRAQDRAVDRKVRGVAEDLTATAKRIDLQQKELEKLASAVESSDGALRQRVDELDATVAQRLQSLADGITSASEQVGAQREEIALLTNALEASDGALRQRVDGLDQALAPRVQELVQGLTAVAERLDTQQDRIASLELAQGASTAGVEQRVEDLESAVRELAAERQALEQLETAVPDDVEARLAELGSFVLGLRDAVDAIETRMSALGADLEDSLAGPRVEPAELERYFEEGRARFDAIVSDLRSLAHMLSTATSRDHDELDRRLDALRDSMGAALERIELLETDAPASSDAASALRVEQLEHELAALRARLRHTSSSEEVAAQLDALRLEVSKVMTRLERTEDIASRTAYNTTSSSSRMSSTVDELAKKIDQLERLEDGLMAKLERAQALWPVALRALEGRIDDLATREHGASADDESLLTALQDGIATAHAVIGESDGAPEHAGNGQPAGPEKPESPRSRPRRGTSKPSRSA